MAGCCRRRRGTRCWRTCRGTAPHEPPPGLLATQGAESPSMTAPDPWHALRAHTAARIALGRAGSSLPTAEWLRFGVAHALARDAVHEPLDAPVLLQDAQGLGLPAWVVE